MPSGHRSRTSISKRIAYRSVLSICIWAQKPDRALKSSSPILYTASVPCSLFCEGTCKIFSYTTQDFYSEHLEINIFYYKRQCEQQYEKNKKKTKSFFIPMLTRTVIALHSCLQIIEGWAYTCRECVVTLLYSTV